LADPVLLLELEDGADEGVNEFFWQVIGGGHGCSPSFRVARADCARGRTVKESTSSMRPLGGNGPRLRVCPDAVSAQSPYFCVKLGVADCGMGVELPPSPATRSWHSGQMLWLAGDVPVWMTRPHQAQTTAGESDGGMKRGL
jgi:hypothetical protein